MYGMGLSRQKPTLPKDFSVSPTSGDIVVGATKDFTVTVSGGLNISTIEVNSSDNTKATVAISGNTITVTAVAAGSATITVSSTDIIKTVDLAITITAAPDFSVAPTSASVVVGATTDLTITVSGGLDINSISAVSSDTGKATVVKTTNKITITGVAAGTSTITVSSSAISKTQDIVTTVTAALFSESINNEASIESFLSQDFSNKNVEKPLSKNQQKKLNKLNQPGNNIKLNKGEE